MVVSCWIASAIRSRNESGTCSRHFWAMTCRSSASKSKASKQGGQSLRCRSMAVRLAGVSSPSKKWYSACTASSQSVTCRFSHGASPTIADQASLLAVLVQPFLQRPSSAMEATHHRTDRDIEDFSDLLVGEALD